MPSITGVINNGVILTGLASLPGSTSMLVVTSSGLMEFQDIPSGGGSVAWADITGKPSEFTPSSHTHPASDIVSGTLSDSLLSTNVARRDQANNLTGLQVISEGVSNTTIRLSDDGIEISRASNGSYVASIIRGAVSTSSSLALDYEANSGHYFKTGSVLRCQIGTAALVTTGGVLSVNTVSSNALTGNANSPITITTDDASASALGIVTNRTNRTSEGANAIHTWQYAGAERARLRTDGRLVSKSMQLGDLTVATLPTASSNAGLEVNVSDSSVTTFGTTVAGGGSSHVKVRSNGTNWTVMGV